MLKSKRIIVYLLAIALLLPVFSGAFTLGASAASDAVPKGYTPIYTASDLDNIRENLSGKYILMNDINLKTRGEWAPVGKDESAPFTGTFDGNGHIIANLWVLSRTKY